MAEAFNAEVKKTITTIDVEVRVVARDTDGNMVAQEPEPRVYRFAVNQGPVTISIDTRALAFEVAP